ncbi:MAG: hypothetical protein ACSLFP_06605 [Acidimicrobiales bacterium]
MITKRDRPLSAPTAAAEPAPPADGELERGVRTLRVGSASVRLSERILLILGGILAPLGLVAVLLGWWGAARTPHLFEQVPYLISGGLLGLGLVFLGSFFYFTHWLTELVKEHRTQSRALLDALTVLQERVERLGGVAAAGTATNGHDPGQVVLVATERGTMAHRAECVVVAGKSPLRPVGVGDGLRPCKLCEPYAPVS